MVAMETAKAVVEVPSPWGGVILALHGKPGDTIATGAPLVDFQAEHGTGAEPPSTAQPATAAASAQSAGAANAAPANGAALARGGVVGHMPEPTMLAPHRSRYPRRRSRRNRVVPAAANWRAAARVERFSVSGARACHTR